MHRIIAGNPMTDPRDRLKIHTLLNASLLALMLQYLIFDQMFSYSGTGAKTSILLTISSIVSVLTVILITAIQFLYTDFSYTSQRFSFYGYTILCLLWTVIAIVVMFGQYF